MARKDRPTAFLFDAAAFLADDKVQLMTPSERGAYISLLCTAYLRTPPATIPADDQALARLAGMTADEWAESRTRVLACWERQTDVYTHRRLRESYDFAMASRSKRSKAGKAGANARWQSHGNRIANECDCSSSSCSGSSSPDPGESEGGALRADSARTREVNPAADYPVGRWFDKFRTVYPAGRVGGVVAARRAFVEAADVGSGSWQCTPLEAAERLCVLAEEYAASARVKGRAKGHVPYAVSWLEKGEWLDPEQWAVAEGGQARLVPTKLKPTGATT